MKCVLRVDQEWRCVLLPSPSGYTSRLAVIWPWPPQYCLPLPQAYQQGRA